MRSALMAAPARAPASAAPTTPAMRSATFPATQTPGTAVSSVASVSMCSPTPRGWTVAPRPRPASTSARATKRGMSATTRDDLAAAHPDAREAVLDDLERRDLLFHGRDAACGQLLRLRIGGLRCGVQEQCQVCRPLADQQHLMRGPRIRCQNPYRLIAELPPVAVR